MYPCNVVSVRLLTYHNGGFSFRAASMFLSFLARFKKYNDTACADNNALCPSNLKKNHIFAYLIQEY